LKKKQVCVKPLDENLERYVKTKGVVYKEKGWGKGKQQKRVFSELFIIAENIFQGMRPRRMGEIDKKKKASGEARGRGELWGLVISLT